MAKTVTSRKAPRKAARKAAARIRIDVHEFQHEVQETGRNLQDLGKKLLADGANVAFDKVERTLVAAQKQLAKVRAQLTPRA
jgi:hypothetical protein